jgi:hypothetical protein
MRRILLLLTSAACLALGCSDDPPLGPPSPPPTPVPDGVTLAGQFERLADSIDGGEYSRTAIALRHAAEIVRLTGHATPVTIGIDGAPRNFLAVAEQIDFPNLVCTFPDDSVFVPPPDSVPSEPPDTTGLPPVPPDTAIALSDSVPVPSDSGVVQYPPECHAEGTYSMRTLIAWEPKNLNEVVRLVAHIGNSEVETDVLDVMTGLPPGSPPSTTPPDSGSGSGGQPGGFPGFMGEYLVRDAGNWYAVAGTQANDLVASAGACTSNRATVDWAEFECEAARLRFQFSMKVDEPIYQKTGPTGDPHDITMSATEVDGVRLSWESWSPPPPVPDTTLVGR